MNAGKVKAKSVMVVSEELPLGLVVNTAAVLGISLGRAVEDILGPEVFDASGERHHPLTKLPIAILKAPSQAIGEIRRRAVTAEYADLVLVDFSHVAQAARTCEEYLKTIPTRTAAELNYLGVALYGEARKVARLTGSLPLLR
jgi:hypothetical protein